MKGIAPKEMSLWKQTFFLFYISENMPRRYNLMTCIVYINFVVLISHLLKLYITKIDVELSALWL